jgi:membrane-associated phospholipid phosphatase
VSSVFLCSFIYLEEKRKLFPLFLAWAIIIAVSTLTTKQHYLIDVMTGLMMALAYYGIFYRYLPYKKTA